MCTLLCVKVWCICCTHASLLAPVIPALIRVQLGNHCSGYKRFIFLFIASQTLLPYWGNPHEYSRE